ncbi:adenosylcobinamide-GDP ribazoletransferase [Sulfolobus acidocaldarius]|uniref:Adenosylcobinamide-GDP ribazoletransferase n=4 Tax=Sulfolobus acidocaldarius TaxID=2285 RepID=COBS_SULAC|nr:adenosylcobinamide-GDP ribazoletransferase [Sulfolobus acidocaldarius]Q4JBK2.1 RecName: Full=Adenosylcobinamide-GDP ribazoletransferase; AltName: Full=Cobalamin synthase; AltName: Full=Cobalamin-5'-phosphate synthase [Sulfolobus acidocaldarius DSM 639]AAY79827.1 conserved Archaeal membrane protein [Sulfolobus acidocaldarius DSM 639]AGE70387.1 cobalamin 5'-phosphate synthase [Sulfolobus acidocaldarius N8]AGE72661.1 cobalamin 5'-phosphate synthase [Sulfolobus acidocaldarius Ron12/I]ALU29221.1
MGRILKAILGQLSFFTIIPSPSASLEEIAEFSFISPLMVGIITGIIDWFVVLLGIRLIGSLGALLLIPTVEIIRGFHHLDGLLDMGDALMVGKERRPQVLHDLQTGSGAIGLFLVYFSIFLIATLNLNVSNLWFFLPSEVLARASAISLLGLMKPIPGSYLGKVFHDKMRDKLFSIKFLLVQVFAILFSSPVLILAYVILLLVFYLMAKLVFDGMSGDIVGAIITLSFPIYLLVAEKTCYHYFIFQYSLTLP